ncbi:hypothetical protein DKT77_01110 [Meridianimarinicoccus roseus]|uniref:Uncharacterized protein n=1 Tax=Meridianimarinicoccus roseus TaxID=2072018 RepID=A0A2V2LN12_9RHOB|nr:hypothetical protein DKT77_01110 [Meridianimarinicoccus roseus]
MVSLLQVGSKLGAQDGRCPCHALPKLRGADLEARRAGHCRHGDIIDASGQDRFARSFERGGFMLLPHPERLTGAPRHFFCNHT